MMSNGTKTLSLVKEIWISRLIGILEFFRTTYSSSIDKVPRQLMATAKINGFISIFQFQVKIWNN